jgi:hypothetical protein
MSGHKGANMTLRAANAVDRDSIFLLPESIEQEEAGPLSGPAGPANLTIDTEARRRSAR